MKLILVLILVDNCKVMLLNAPFGILLRKVAERNESKGKKNRRKRFIYNKEREKKAIWQRDSRNQIKLDNGIRGKIL